MFSLTRRRLSSIFLWFVVTTRFRSVVTVSLDMSVVAMVTMVVIGMSLTMLIAVSGICFAVSCFGINLDFGNCESNGDWLRWSYWLRLTCLFLKVRNSDDSSWLKYISLHYFKSYVSFNELSISPTHFSWILNQIRISN